MSALRWIWRSHQKRPTLGHLVVITGCDSGFGFHLALRCHSLNLRVIATVLNPSSDGAVYLRNYCPDKTLQTVQLDVTKAESVLNMSKFVTNLFNKTEKEFTLINNAGCMTFGEFEWLTEDFLKQQIDVNLLGTMRVTKSLLPLLRKHKGRVINVTSHCSLIALPGLSVYAASKVGVKFWSDALRIELRKFGVDVVNFIPGSFIQSSNIGVEQLKLADQMKKNLSDEQILIYGNYFDTYFGYLKAVLAYKSPLKVDFDQSILNEMEKAIFDLRSNQTYKVEPYRYKFYHSLFALTSGRIREWLIQKFIQMPNYKH